MVFHNIRLYPEFHCVESMHAWLYLHILFNEVIKWLIFATAVIIFTLTAVWLVGPKTMSTASVKISQWLNS